MFGVDNIGNDDIESRAHATQFTDISKVFADICSLKVTRLIGEGKKTTKVVYGVSDRCID